MKLYDYTNGLKATHYARTEQRIGFAFSNEDDMIEHVENERIFDGQNVNIKFGSIDKIIGKYQIIDWELKEAKERKS